MCNLKASHVCRIDDGRKDIHNFIGYFFRTKVPVNQFSLMFSLFPLFAVMIFYNEKIYRRFKDVNQFLSAIKGIVTKDDI